MNNEFFTLFGLIYVGLNVTCFTLYMFCLINYARRTGQNLFGGKRPFKLKDYMMFFVLFLLFGVFIMLAFAVYMINTNYHELINEA